MTNQPIYYTKTVAFDQETEALVRDVIKERGFPESQGFSLALRTIIREHARLTQSNAPVAQARPSHAYPQVFPVGG